MDLLSSCVYLSQVNAYQARTEINKKATGRSMPMILARTQWAGQCPKESNFQFSTFLRDEQSKSRKKERKAIPGQFLFAISQFPSVHLLDRGVVIDSYYCISSICM
jgi:hypothetical protein